VTPLLPFAQASFTQGPPPPGGAALAGAQPPPPQIRAMAEQAVRHVWAIRQQQQRQQLQQQQQQHQQQPQRSTAQPQPSPSPAQPAPTPPPPTQPAPPPQPTGALPPASNVLAALMNAVAQTPGEGDAAESGMAELTSAIDWMLQFGNNALSPINAGEVLSNLLGGQGDLFAAPSQVGIFSSHILWRNSSSLDAVLQVCGAVVSTAPCLVQP
jgi:hypothetical protein